MQSKEERILYKTKIKEIARQGELPHFDEELEAEADKLPTKLTQAEIDSRRDFRTIATCTIDPDDAKDFDDALSVEFKKNGDIEVGIHIADVSHYVTPGSLLDEEAFKRGTSIYLAQRVIPMLPEKISNELCSLKEGVDRPTYSVVCTFNKNQTLTGTWFGRTVIHSDKRYTYTKAQEVLDKGEGLLFKELDALNTLAKKLFEKRVLNGALILEDAELSFTYNGEGHPIDVHTKTRLQTHKLVEEWMLLANRKVAELFEKNDRAFVYRIHDKPDVDKLKEVAVRAKEYKLNFPKKIQNDLLNEFIESIELPYEKSMFSKMIMRSMAKAIYSAKNIGHYGLGFKHYTHFTSPIRRYPDLIAHRLLNAKLNGETPKIIVNLFEKDLGYLSTQERYAQDIERASQKDMQIMYMQDRIGEKRTGYVTGLTEHGVYVADMQSNSEGMIHVRALGNSWMYNERGKFWKNKVTSAKIKIGDVIEFIVAKVNFEKGTIDYTLCEKK